MPNSTQLAASAYTVYRLYDAEHLPLYVGVTSNWPHRRSGHLDKPWWSRVDESLTAFSWHDSVSEAAVAEREAIKAEQPEFNISGRSRRYNGYHGTSEDRRRHVAELDPTLVERVSDMTEERRIAMQEMQATELIWREHIKSALTAGYSQVAVADAAGVTQGRVAQILATPR